MMFQKAFKTAILIASAGFLVAAMGLTIRILTGEDNDTSGFLTLKVR